MACASRVVRGNNEELQERIRDLFTTFIKPSTVLHQFKKFLKRKDYEFIQARLTNEGDLEAAHHLLNKLAQKNDWFHSLLDILQHPDVKLQHIARMMEQEKQNLMTTSEKSVSSLFIKYNNKMEKKIREAFVNFVNPNDSRVFHKHSSNTVLTKNDIENVQAKVSSHGDNAGAQLLLERLVLYENWFDVLLQVLRDPDIKLGHAADEMEKATIRTRQWYKHKKQIYEKHNLDERIQHHNKKTSTHLPVGTAMQDISNSSFLTADDEFESDSAEMRADAEVLPQGYGNADKNLSKSERHLSTQTGESLLRDGNSGKTALMAAAEAGNADQLILLTETSDINYADSRGWTALMCAAQKSQIECVQLLIILACDVNKQDCNGNTALKIACGEGHTKCVTILIKGQADVNVPNKRGNTALMVTAKRGYVDCMRLLFDEKIDPNIRNNDGLTALMYAAHYGHSACVKLLSDQKCNVNMCDDNGCTALMYAADNGHSECVKLLIDRCCDVNMCDSNGLTPLMYAAKYGHSECVKLLTDRRSINKCNSKEQTALMLAAKNGHSDCVKLLIEGGADIDMYDKKGNTAIMLALQHQHKECVELLNNLHI